MSESTLRPSEHRRGGDPDDRAVPAALVVFSGGEPCLAVRSFVDGVLELGRDHGIDDKRVSRRHARLGFDGQRFTVTDLGSQNGTSADGAEVGSKATAIVERVVRIGDTLLVPIRDGRGHDGKRVRVVDCFVRGPAMQAVLDDVGRAADSGAMLHIRGESGCGKEGVALAFHQRGARGKGAFVPVNCGAIPPNLAERLLFGAKRGAYSGADQDTLGYFGEADGGTLFLDEIGDLDEQVQVKLLRALEAKEILQLGAARPKKIDVRFCSATNKDLRQLVALGKLREDLYYRIARPDVIVPALRERPDEIAYLVCAQIAVAAPALAPHVSLIEQCLLRPWHGNVRELNVEIRAAATLAASTGAARVEAEHLRDSAGKPFAIAPSTSAAVARPQPPLDDDRKRSIEEALSRNNGNVTATARALGMHRNQLRRLIERHEIAIKTK